MQESTHILVFILRLAFLYLIFISAKALFKKAKDALPHLKDKYNSSPTQSIWLIFIAVAALMFLFPPTEETTYSPFLPERKSFEGWMAIWTLQDNPTDRAIRSISYPILLCQWAIIGALGLALTFKKK